MREVPLTLLEQGELLEALANRCVCHDGTVAEESFLSITKQEAEDLIQLCRRLYFMAPFQNRIEKLVRGK